MENFADVLFRGMKKFAEIGDTINFIVFIGMVLLALFQLAGMVFG